MTTTPNAVEAATTDLPSAAPKELTDSAIMLDVRIGKLGVRRKAKAKKVDPKATLPFKPEPGTVITDADPKLVSVSAKILDCPEFDAIAQYDGQTRAFLTQMELRTSFARDGMHVFSLGVIEEVYAWLIDRREHRQPLIETFLTVYEQPCEQTGASLRSLAQVADHSCVDEARAAFTMWWLPLAFDVPRVMKKLKTGLYEKERDRVAADLRGAVDEIKNGMAAAFYKLVVGMKEALE